VAVHEPQAHAPHGVADAGDRPQEQVQSPPSTRGRSPRPSVAATASRKACEDARRSAKPMIPVSGSRTGSRSGRATSPASAAPNAAGRPAARNASGACSSPRPVPEESRGAPSTTHTSRTLRRATSGSAALVPARGPAPIDRASRARCLIRRSSDKAERDDQQGGAEHQVGAACRDARLLRGRARLRGGDGHGLGRSSPDSWTWG
jgi:hypothetical protein